MVTFLILAAIVVGLELLLHGRGLSDLALLTSQRKLIAALKDCIVAKDRLIETQRRRIAVQDLHVETLQRRIVQLEHRMEEHDGIPAEPR